MDKKQELTLELRRARGWILAVGIIMFVWDMIFTFGVHGNELPTVWKQRIVALDCVMLGIFVGLWWLARSKPKLACTLALVVFWAIQIAGAVLSGEPESLFKGIVLKVLFTLALVRGLKSATRAQLLKDELATVFE
jgi:hypothetical protein